MRHNSQYRVVCFLYRIIKIRLKNRSKKELTCKPGSVVDNHSSRTDIAICLKQPTRERCGSHLCY